MDKYIYLYTLIVCQLGLIMCLVMLKRNDNVFKYRNHISELMFDAGEDDIENNREWKWRLEIYKTVTYRDMMRKFWKPLDTFYPDKSFIEKGKKNVQQ